MDLPLRVFFDSPTIALQAIAIKGKQIEQTDARALAEMLAQVESLPEDEAQRLVAVLETGNAQEIPGSKS
jgi:hypothetical protein